MTDPRRNPKSYRRRISIDGPWVPRSKTMLESPAYRALSRAAHQVLSRIEIEHLKHGGYENSKLPVTYDQFVAYGLRRHSIAPALRELVSVQLIEVTERGRSGHGEWHSPNQFRLTYLNSGRADPTNEWQHIKTMAEARSLVKAARQDQKTPRKKNKTPLPVSANFHCRKPSVETSISIVGNRQCRPLSETVSTSISGLPLRTAASAQSLLTSAHKLDELDKWLPDSSWVLP